MTIHVQRLDTRRIRRAMLKKDVPRPMPLWTEEQGQQLLANGKLGRRGYGVRKAGAGNQPVIKLFTPDGAMTWLLSELRDRGRLLFGLCDLGFGEPELGYVSVQEVSGLRGQLGLPVERDLHWTPRHTLMDYFLVSRNQGSVASNADMDKAVANGLLARLRAEWEQL